MKKDNSALLNKAMKETATKPASNVPAEDPAMMEDGTVTIPDGILPESAKEGDIIQMEYVAHTDAGCVLKPVESRIKQPGMGNADVKAAGPDNSSVVGSNPMGTNVPMTY